MIKKRERAVFLGNRLKVIFIQFFISTCLPNYFHVNFFFQEFSEDYHAKKSLDATVSENVGSLISGTSARTLMRSNSIQDELLTTF